MVENSVGRIWIEHLRAVDPSTDEKATAERFGWKYYLPEAEQEESVNVKLAEIRTTYKDLKPTDITCIDPCMGSGHILIAMFDVLMDIYESDGYDKREAAFEIVEHNIHGLDIFKDGREYGSILNVAACDWEVLERFVDDLGTTGQISFESVGGEETQKQLRKLVRVAKNLGQKYDAVVTNPPYMGASGMGAKLSKNESNY